MEKPKRMKRTWHAGPFLTCLCAAVAVTAGGCGLFGSPKEVPGWQAKIDAILGEPITCDFDHMPLDDMIAFFRYHKHVNIVVDERSSLSRGTQVLAKQAYNKVPFKDVLAACLRQVGLIYTVRDEAILICTRKRLTEIEARARPVDTRPKPPEYPSSWRVCPPPDAWLYEPTSFDCIATPLDDVTAFFRNLKKVNIIVDWRALANKGSMDITLRLEKVSFRAALDWVCTLLDLNYIITDHAIYISTPAGVDAIAKTKTQVEYWNRPSLTPIARKWVETALDEPVSFDFIATPLEDVAAFFRNAPEANIIVDGQAIGAGDHDVTLRLNKVALRDALTWICRLEGLAYIITDGAICLSTPEGVKVIEKNKVEYWDKRSMTPETKKSIEAVLDERISINLRGATLHEFIDWSNEIRKVKIIADTRAIGVEDNPLTRQLKVISMRQALTWGCRLKNLAWVVTDGRIVITTPEAARKLAKP